MPTPCPVPLPAMVHVPPSSVSTSIHVDHTVAYPSKRRRSGPVIVRALLLPFTTTLLARPVFVFVAMAMDSTGSPPRSDLNALSTSLRGMRAVHACRAAAVHFPHFEPGKYDS